MMSHPRRSLIFVPQYQVKRRDSNELYNKIANYATCVCVYVCVCVRARVCVHAHT
jgi:hypothetical protein